jgi:kinesin family protein 18/19
MKKGVDNIMVAVRLRPLWRQESDANEFNIVKILDEKLVIIQDPQDFENDGVKNELRKNRTREKRYAFDFAFDETASNDRVFNSTTKFLCDGVLEGFNSTVFAYGATGSGKTHTMLGTNDQPGVMFQTMSEIFLRLQELLADRDYEIRISFLEIYNENIRDLTEFANAGKVEHAS